MMKYVFAVLIGCMIWQMGIAATSQMPMDVLEARAQGQANIESNGESGNYLLKSVTAAIVFLVMLMLFYRGVYPYLLSHYWPGKSKLVLSSLVFLYSLIWFALCTVFFGFWWNHYSWIKYVYIFMLILSIIWMGIVFLKHDEDYFK